MIGVSLDKTYVESLDYRPTSGRMLLFQIGPLTFTFYIGWGR